MKDPQSNEDGFPVLLDEATNMVQWLEEQRNDPVTAASTFFSYVEDLLKNKRAVPSFVVDAANRCHAAALSGDVSAAMKEVDAAINLLMGHFPIVRMHE
jgi:hypothetical protein